MPSITIQTQGLLFDNDGTLVDSTGSVDRSWRRWAAEFGVADPESVQIAHGTRALDIMRGIVPDVDPEAGLRRIEDIEINDTEGIVLLPGVKSLLETLPPHRWTIVTSATHRLMVVRLAAAGLPQPAELITADCVTHGKPHPEPYIKGAAVLGLTPADCIVVEDAPSGVQSGREAGSRVLALTTTHSAEVLREAGADWIIPSLAHLTATPTANGLTLTLEIP